VILGWIADDTASAAAAATASRAARAWADDWTVTQHVGRWRAAFPVARAASVSGNKRLCDADCLCWCTQPTIMDAGRACLEQAGISHLRF